MSRSFWLALLCGSALAAGGFSGAALADGQGKGQERRRHTGGQPRSVCRALAASRAAQYISANLHERQCQRHPGQHLSRLLRHSGRRAPPRHPGIDREFGGPGPADYNQLQLEVRGVAAPLARRQLPDLYGLQCRGRPRRGVEFGNDKPDGADSRRMLADRLLRPRRRAGQLQRTGQRDAARFRL